MPTAVYIDWVSVRNSGVTPGISPYIYRCSVILPSVEYLLGLTGMILIFYHPDSSHFKIITLSKGHIFNVFIKL